MNDEKKAREAERKRNARKRLKDAVEGGDKDAIEKHNATKAKRTDTRHGRVGVCSICGINVGKDDSFLICGNKHIVCFSRCFETYQVKVENYDQRFDKICSCPQCQMDGIDDDNAYYIAKPLVTEALANIERTNMETLLQKTKHDTESAILDRLEREGIDALLQPRYVEKYMNEIDRSTQVDSINAILCPGCGVAGNLHDGCTLIDCANMNCNTSYCAWCLKDLTDIRVRGNGGWQEPAHEHVINCEIRHKYEPRELVLSLLGPFYSKNGGKEALERCQRDVLKNKFEDVRTRIHNDTTLSDESRRKLLEHMRQCSTICIFE